MQKLQNPMIVTGICFLFIAVCGAQEAMQSSQKKAAAEMSPGMSMCSGAMGVRALEKMDLLPASTVTSSASMRSV